MNNLKIEVGKFYKTRDDRKVRIYAIDGGNPGPIHGAIITRNTWTPATWHLSGSYFGTANKDIVSEWIEFDFNVLPAWCDKYIAMDQNGKWSCYKKMPFIHRGCWIMGQDTTFNINEIPTKYAPKWECNWKDSLTMNPKYK